MTSNSGCMRTVPQVYDRQTICLRSNSSDLNDLGVPTSGNASNIQLHDAPQLHTRAPFFLFRFRAPVYTLPALSLIKLHMQRQHFFSEHSAPPRSSRHLGIPVAARTPPHDLTGIQNRRSFRRTSTGTDQQLLLLSKPPSKHNQDFIWMHIKPMHWCFRFYK